LLLAELKVKLHDVMALIPAVNAGVVGSVGNLDVPSESHAQHIYLVPALKQAFCTENGCVPEALLIAPPNEVWPAAQLASAVEPPSLYLKVK